MSNPLRGITFSKLAKADPATTAFTDADGPSLVTQRA